MCSSCAAKQQAMGYALNEAPLKLTIPQECKYTFEQVSEKRTELVENNGNALHISYLTSALNMWNKNCNLFEKRLDEIFM